MSAATLLLCSSAFALSPTVTVDGIQLEESLVEEGLTYVPLTSLLQALGPWETAWNAQQRTAVARTDLFTLEVPIGSKQVQADGYIYDLAGEVIVHNGRTYAPLRSLAGLLGADVTFSGWDNPITVTPRVGRHYTEEDLYWLSRVISAESQGEDLLGQIAVGNVVLNRMDSPIFPDSIRNVIFDTKDAVQFEPTGNGTIYLEPTAQSVLAAKLALNGATAVEDCLYFFNPSLSRGKWIRDNCTYFTTIGCHRFYR